MMEALENILIVLLFALISAICVTAAYGHPGALDNDDCHVVRQDWKYKDGKTLKKSSRHCHSPLNAMALDGKQLLEDREDRGEPVKDKSKEKPK